MSSDSGSLQETPPDDEFRDAAEEIEFLAAIREAETDVAQGKLVPHGQMEARLEQWLSE